MGRILLDGGAYLRAAYHEHPEHAVVHDALTILRQTGAELGFSPQMLREA